MSDFWRWLWKELVEALSKPSVDGPSVSGSVVLGSGYSVEAERMNAAEKLLALCEDIIADPALDPSDVDGDGKLDTKCNFAVQKAARAFGCFELDGLVADQIVDRLRSGILPEWDNADGERAARHAQRGGFAIAGKQYDGHGHVAVIAPKPMERSWSWGKDVPVIANVGRPHDGFMRTSEAFRAVLGEPEYWTFGTTA